MDIKYIIFSKKTDSELYWLLVHIWSYIFSMTDIDLAN
jgi:hypothetical protein